MAPAVRGGRRPRWWPAAALPVAVGSELRRVVVLARHSVKNPYPWTAARPLEPGVAHAPLTAYTGKALPPFPVPPGELTPNGKELMRLLGAYHRERYGALLGDTPCQRAAILSDPGSRRDVESAEAFAQGLAGQSGCGVNAGADVERLRRGFRDRSDAWDEAHGCVVPSAEEVASLFGISASQLSPLGGPSAFATASSASASWLRVYRQQLSRMQDITQCCSPEACAVGGAAAPPGGICTIFGLPLTIAPNVTWRAIGGGLGVGARFAEIFAMQYCEGLEAGWGLREEDMVELLSLLELPVGHAGANEVTARNLGSVLLDELLSALNPAHPDSSPRMTVYFGHDTNLHFLRQMLRLEWLSEGWWPNVAEPGAQLVFEVYDDDGGGQSVQLLKVAATPKQQRTRAQLSMQSPPSVTPLWVPGCGALRCPLPQFLALGRAALRADCVPPRSPVAAEPVAAKAPAAATPVAAAAAVAAPQAAARTPAAAAWAAAPPQAEVQPPQAAPAEPAPAGSSSSFVFFLVVAVAGYVGWTYLQKKRAEGKGYETLGSSSGRFHGGAGGSAIGSPGFVL